MPGIYDLTNQNIEDTYQRLLQTPDGLSFYDGTGSAITITAAALAGGSNTQIQFNSASLLSGSSNFSFNYTTNNVLLTGSLITSGSNTFIGNQYITGSIYIPDNAYSIYFSGSGPASRLVWNNTDGTLDLGLKGGAVTLQIGQEQVVRVVNKTGINLTEAGYQAVRISGAQGNRLKVALAKGDADGNSLDTLGLVTENIDVNQEGFITVAGLIRGIDTTGNLQGETWTDGDALYLSPTVFGGLTKNIPIAPSHSVRMGYVVQSNPSQGSIFVKVDNGYEIDELHNVQINTSSLSYGDLLMYDANVWYNTKTLTGSYTLSGSLKTNDGVSVQSLTASFVSASSITGSLFGLASSASLVRVSSSNFINNNFSLTFVPYSPDMDDYRLLQTDNSLFYNPFTNTLTLTNLNGTATNAIQSSTASYTPNALVTASVSSNVLTFTKGNGSTFNLTIATGSGGGGSTSPGGTDTSIQYKTGSEFGGDNVLLYQYDASSNNKYRLSLSPNLDFSTTPYTSASPGSIVIKNDPADFKAFVSITSYTAKGNANSISTVLRFTAIDISNILVINGFKCDYALDANKEGYHGSRVGTLMCSLNNDTSMDINLVDSSITGDTTLNLSSVKFTAQWEDQYTVLISMDLTNVSQDVAFTGLFTFFHQLT